MDKFASRRTSVSLELGRTANGSTPATDAAPLYPFGALEKQPRLQPSSSSVSLNKEPLQLWLSEHHLDAYYDKLVTEDITYDLLGELRKEDLKLLIPKVGDRIRFWRALCEHSLVSRNADVPVRRPTPSGQAISPTGQVQATVTPISASALPATPAVVTPAADPTAVIKRVKFFKPDMSALTVDIASTSSSSEIKSHVIATAQLSPLTPYSFHDGFDYYDNNELLHHAIFSKGMSELNILAKDGPGDSKPEEQRLYSPPTMDRRPTSDEITNNLAGFFPEAGRRKLNASVRHSVYVQNRLFMVEDHRQSLRFSKRMSFVSSHESTMMALPQSEKGRRASLLSVHQLAERAVAVEGASSTPSPSEEHAQTKNDDDGEAWDKYFEDDDGLFLKELEREEMNPTEWVRGKLIGHGSFGDVYLAIILFSGGFQAVKQVPLLEGDDRMRKMADALRHEIMMLRKLEHRNIVQYRGFKSEGEYLNIFLEYVPGGSLASLLADVQTISEPLIKLYIKQCLVGLAYLHSKGIIHRDIKGANVLVSLNGVVKISDFGLSLQEDAARVRQSMQGTAFFMAPEVARGRGGVTTKADVWSLGCLIVELFTGQHPYPTLLQVQALWAVGRGTAPEVPETASPELKEVLEKCFKMDPEERASAEELLALSFFEGVQIPDDAPSAVEFN